VKPVFLRVGWTIIDRRLAIVLNLARRDGKVVVMTGDGWSVVEGAQSPVTFLSSASLGELPLPAENGDLSKLRPLINLPDAQYSMFLGLVLRVLLEGESAIGAFYGEDGSGKAFTVGTATKIFDPRNSAGEGWAQQVVAIREGEDLAEAADGKHAAAFADVGVLSRRQCDVLTRIASGLPETGRKAGSAGQSPSTFGGTSVFLTSETEALSGADLLNRALIFRPEKIVNPRPARDLQEEFVVAWPDILGGFCDAACYALKAIESGEVDDFEWDRQPDFQRWVTAAEPALGLERGTIVRQMREASLDAEVASLEGYPAVLALLEMLEGGDADCPLRPAGEVDTLRGTLTAVLEAAKAFAGDRSKSAHWPANAQVLATRLDACAGTLDKLGVDIKKGRGKDRYTQLKLQNGPGIVREEAEEELAPQAQATVASDEPEAGVKNVADKYRAIRKRQQVRPV
jgi:hypothetical protein